MTDQATMTNPFAAIAVPELDDQSESVEQETAAEEIENVEETIPDEEQTDEPETTEEDGDDSEVEAEAEQEEDETDEVDAEETDEEGDADEDRRTITYRYYGKDHEFDPFENPEETARLIQLGKDYDKKTTLNDAMSKGIVKYDLETGGLVPGQAFEEAKVTGAKTVIDALMKQGVIVESATGPTLAPAVQQALQTPSTPDTSMSDKIAKLEAAFAEDQSNENFLAWQRAVVEQEIAQKFQNRDSTREAEQKKQAEAAQIQQAIAQAKSNITSKANELKSLFKQADGSFDEEAWKVAHDDAQQYMLLRDANGHYQYDTAMKRLDAAAQRHAKRVSATVKATTNRRKVKKTAKTPVSRPSQGKASATKNEVKFDPSNPFAHIRNPEL